MVRPITGLVAVLVGVSATVATSHPLHTSFTEIVRERSGHVALSVRLFADDFGKTLDSLAALPASRGSEIDAVAQRYFEQTVALVGRNRATVPLAWCGMRSVDGLTFLCARSVEPVPGTKLRFRNRLMFDRFADQLSIVRWTSRSTIKTLVLSPRAAEGPLY
jgi:hypothetical protein